MAGKRGICLRVDLQVIPARDPEPDMPATERPGDAVAAPVIGQETVAGDFAALFLDADIPRLRQRRERLPILGEERLGRGLDRCVLAGVDLVLKRLEFARKVSKLSKELPAMK